ncbi:MAG TPA: hypothetical protein VIE88_07315, partial [Vicinamibacteria bacterium]
MISLRTRLIVGVALVALVPIAVTTFVLAKRVETTVHAEASKRLDAALGGLTAELQSSGDRIEGGIEILARDPVLKRLYLLQPSGSRDLNDHLAERRFLLALDFLHVRDDAGDLVGDGSTPPAATPLLALSASAPILYERKPAGTVSGGIALDAPFLDRLKRTTGLELVLRDGNGQVVAATVDSAEARFLPSLQTAGRVTLAGQTFVSRSVPLELGGTGHAGVTGLITTASADQTIAALRWTSLLLGVAGMGIAILLGALWSSQVSRPVERLAAYSRKLAQGEWGEPLRVPSVPEL